MIQITMIKARVIHQITQAKEMIAEIVMIAAAAVTALVTLERGGLTARQLVYPEQLHLTTAGDAPVAP